MSCPVVNITVYQGDSFSKKSGFVDEDKNHFDLSSATGEAKLLLEGKTVHTFPLALSYTDANTKNIEFALNSTQTTAIAVGEYQTVFKITLGSEVYYLPDEGILVLNVREAL